MLAMGLAEDGGLGDEPAEDVGDGPTVGLEEGDATNVELGVVWGAADAR
jgi:hypothetical protein